MKIKINLNKKKTLTYFLALSLVASPILVNAAPELEVKPISAEVEVIKPINSEVIPISEELKVPNYIEFTGKITNIESKDNMVSILAENDLESALDKLVAHISDDVVLLDEETMGLISVEDLEEGMEVSIYYDKETIMLMSYPPQLGPDVIVVKSDDVDLNIKIDKFDEELTSDDNNLKLNIDEDVKLIDLKGEKIEKEDLANKDLVVFYTISTRSIPAQATPKKIIAIRNHEVKIFDYLNLNDVKFELDNKMYKNDDGELMVPLRQIAEALGYEVEWANETKSVNITKEGYASSLTIGENEYQYYDMLLELTAPELTESKTYVPVSFIEDILVSNLEVTMDGVLEIIKFEQ
ncbi:MAG: stalk domain-containing protein [Tissierellaceae bacterium]|nr:stalk domain-containing protein [Tissierellaceae bacterium]